MPSMTLLPGFGYTGYRSVHGPLQIVGPLSKVNLLAGQNNAGKSNVLRYVRDFLCAPRHLAPTGLDMPRGRHEASFHEFAVAVHKDLVAIPEILKRVNQRQVGEALEKLVQLPALRLAGDDLLWFRFRLDEQRASRARVISDRQISEVVKGSNPRELSTLASALTSGSGRPEADARAILSLLVQKLTLPSVSTIDAFRRIVPGEASDGGSHSGEGLILELAQLQNPSAYKQGDKQKLEAINRFVQTVLDDHTAEIEIPYERDTINVVRSGDMLPLEHLGTGIHQVIIMAAAATILEHRLICMEEPEIHLHPLLQRKLIRYLNDNPSNQYIIATHSAHLLDYECARIFHVRFTLNEGTTVTSARTPAEVSTICADLGYRPSDLLQANAVLWVEGPSDRVYLGHWLRQEAPSLIEGIHYSIMYYGGRLLKHLTANDPEVEEFISLRSLNRNIAILIDSDKTSAQARINDTKRRVRDEFEREGYPGFAWVTDGCMIENYLSRDTLARAVARVHPTKQFSWDASKWSNPLGSIVNVDKVGVARNVCAEWDHASAETQLRRHLRKTVEFILTANGLA